MLNPVGSRRQTVALILLGSAVLLIASLLGWIFRAPASDGLSPISRASERHQALDCASIDRRNLLVILLLGQSNAANHGQTRGDPVANVFSFHDGHCYRAADPLPGATGDGGSVWMRLAPHLLRPGQVDAVLLAPLAVNSTSISQWNAHPLLLEGLQRMVGQLTHAGFHASMVLWHQGEAESFKGTSGDAYREGFAQMLQRLRQLGVDATVWVALATRCQARSNTAVHAAQAELPRLHAGTRAGPDLDRLFDPYHRYDGCHFSTPGLEAAALAWRSAIAEGLAAQAPVGVQTR